MCVSLHNPCVNCKTLFSDFKRLTLPLHQWFTHFNLRKHGYVFSTQTVATTKKQATQISPVLVGSTMKANKVQSSHLSVYLRCQEAAINKQTISHSKL